MENKTTTELLDIIGAYSIKEREEATISDKETDAYVDAIDELIKRPPFIGILLSSYDETKESLESRIESLEENSENFQKKVKRHKHDSQSGDVMIRI